MNNTLTDKATQLLETARNLDDVSFDVDQCRTRRYARIEWAITVKGQPRRKSKQIVTATFDELISAGVVKEVKVINSYTIYELVK